MSLGGLRELQDEKNRIRNEHGLPALPEDPYEVYKKMRASSPPASAADLIEQQLPKRSFRGKRVCLLKMKILMISYLQIIQKFHFNFDSMQNLCMVTFHLSHTHIYLCIRYGHEKYAP